MIMRLKTLDLLGKLPAPSSISGAPKTLPQLLHCHRREDDHEIVEIHTTLLSEILGHLYDNLRTPVKVNTIDFILSILIC